MKNQKWLCKVNLVVFLKWNWQCYHLWKLVKRYEQSHLKNISVFLVCFNWWKQLGKTEINLQNILFSNMFMLLKRFWITILNFLCNTTLKITSVTFYMIIKLWAVSFRWILNFVFKLVVKCFINKIQMLESEFSSFFSTCGCARNMCNW